MDRDRSDLMREYLARQQYQAGIPNTSLSDSLLQDNSSVNLHVNPSALVPQQTMFSEEELEHFKQQVRTWLSIDTEVRDISAKIRFLNKERLHRKTTMDVLKSQILNFMRVNDIQTLNSREGGTLRIKTSYVKTSLTQKTLKDRLHHAFGNDPRVKEKLQDIFDNRERRAQQCLLRS